MAGDGFVEVNEIQDIVSYIKSIEWRETWLYCLIIFHVSISTFIYLSRNMVNLQISLFCGLLLLVYFSEFLNEIAARHWMLYSRQQYFDSNGMFISLIFSTPILLNCLFMLARFLYQNMELMAKVKTAELIEQQKQLKMSTNGQQQQRDSKCHTVAKKSSKKSD